jgi:hypothetical protein
MLLEFAALKDDIWEHVDPATLKDQLPKLVQPVQPTPTFVQSLNIDNTCVSNANTGQVR